MENLILDISKQRAANWFTPQVLFPTTGDGYDKGMLCLKR